MAFGRTLVEDEELYSHVTREKGWVEDAALLQFFKLYELSLSTILSYNDPADLFPCLCRSGVQLF